MSEAVDEDVARYPAEGPMPRCCPRHEDWTTLFEHLLQDFPQLSISVVVREISSAKRAVETAGIELPDQLLTGEVVARHQLALLSGRRVDAARLDPERHLRG